MPNSQELKLFYHTSAVQAVGRNREGDAVNKVQEKKVEKVNEFTWKSLRSTHVWHVSSVVTIPRIASDEEKPSSLGTSNKG